MNICLEVIKTSSFFIDWGISMMDFVLSILSGIISGVVASVVINIYLRSQKRGVWLGWSFRI